MPILKSQRLNDKWIRDHLADFLLDCPCFFARDYIPPLSIVNLRLKAGEWRPSMNPGVKWKPFEICQLEYDELVKQLRSWRRKRLKFGDYPKSIGTEDDWTIFLYELLDGVPAKEHKRSLQKVRAAEQARNGVLFYGKKGNVSELSEKAILATLGYSDFLEHYKRRNV